jgi:hypothetical protein
MSIQETSEKSPSYFPIYVNQCPLHGRVIAITNASSSTEISEIACHHPHVIWVFRFLSFNTLANLLPWKMDYPFPYISVFTDTGCNAFLRHSSFGRDDFFRQRLFLLYCRMRKM